MSRDSWIILRFATLGLAIAAIFFAFIETKSPVESSVAEWAYGSVLILCPGFTPFAWWMAAGEVPVQNVELMWLIIGLINYVLYGALGAVYVRFRNWRAGTARI